jgi:hypothetical protein
MVIPKFAKGESLKKSCVAELGVIQAEYYVICVDKEPL